jgi:excisionase family DNA binding protein
MRFDAAIDIAQIVADPACVADLRADDVPALLGTLEQLRAALWARMLRGSAPVTQDLDGPIGDRLLTVPEVAAEMRFTRGYVYDAVRRGQLAAVRTGKYVRIRRAALTAWLDGHPSITLDGHATPADSVKPTGHPPAESVSRRSQPSRPGRKDRTSSGTRRVETSAATIQRTDT